MIKFIILLNLSTLLIQIECKSINYNHDRSQKIQDILNSHMLKTDIKNNQILQTTKPFLHNSRSIDHRTKFLNAVNNRQKFYKFPRNLSESGKKHLNSDELIIGQQNFDKSQRPALITNEKIKQQNINEHEMQHPHKFLGQNDKNLQQNFIQNFIPNTKNKLDTNLIQTNNDKVNGEVVDHHIINDENKFNSILTKFLEITNKLIKISKKPQKSSKLEDKSSDDTTNGPTSNFTESSKIKLKIESQVHVNDDTLNNLDSKYSNLEKLDINSNPNQIRIDNMSPMIETDDQMGKKSQVLNNTV